MTPRFPQPATIGDELLREAGRDQHAERPWWGSFEQIGRDAVDLARWARPCDLVRDFAEARARADDTRCRGKLGTMRCGLERGHGGHLHRAGRSGDNGSFIVTTWPVSCPLCGQPLGIIDGAAGRGVHPACAARENAESDR